MSPFQILTRLTHDARVYVAGHRGLVGSALCRQLESLGIRNLVVRDRADLDLINQTAVDHFFAEERIDFVFLAAAKVGGILYNSMYPADFLYENLMIAGNVVHAAARNNVKKLVFLGSSCIYPKLSPQPIKEEALLTGPLEPTNEGYALAKIAGLKLCEKFNLQYGKCFVSMMPTNMYGPNDNYHPERSHVIPAMLRRFHEAKINRVPRVSVWGTGAARREFLHVDDFARAAITVMEQYDSPQTINVGTGSDITIKELTMIIRETVGYEGEIDFDTSRPDGTPRKVLDVERIKSLGWNPEIPLREGLQRVYRDAVAQGVFESGTSVISSLSK